MSTKNNDVWKNREDSLFKDLDGAGVKDTPPVDDYTPSSSRKRQILNILFVIDVSGSMRGERIAQVNYALENIFDELRTREDLNSSIKVGIMEFSDEAKWLMNRPIPLEDYVFTQIEAQPWFTYYAKAFRELEKKLHSGAFMNPDLGEYFAPLILFITDGEPVDVADYPKALDELKNNKWFRKSAKYAVAVGEDAKTEEIGRLLSQFTGVINNVRYADEGAALCKLIEFIAVRASEVQTSMVGDGKANHKGSIFPDADEHLFSSIFDTKK